MGDNSILQRYTSRQEEGVAGHGAAGDSDSMDDLGAFGWLRGIRDRAVSLELRRKDGSILAVSYGYVEKAQFDPSEGITIFAGGQKIRIKGRNLNTDIRPAVRLFDGLARHRVPWLRESDRESAMNAPETAVVIESIEW